MSGRGSRQRASPPAVAGLAGHISHLLGFHGMLGRCSAVFPRRLGTTGRGAANRITPRDQIDVNTWLKQRERHSTGVFQFYKRSGGKGCERGYMTPLHDSRTRDHTQSAKQQAQAATRAVCFLSGCSSCLMRGLQRQLRGQSSPVRMHQCQHLASVETSLGWHIEPQRARMSRWRDVVLST